MIPAFNEEKTLEHVVNQIIDLYGEYDYIIINDGSTDRTPEICREKGYNFIDLPINTGLGIVIQTGFKYALYNGYDYAVQFDCDGQHYPEYIEGLLTKALEGYNLVIGSRFMNMKKGFKLRMLGSRILSLLIYLTTDRYIADPTSGFRIYDRDMMKFYARDMNAYPEPDDLVYQLQRGKKIAEIPVEMGDRIAGLSYFNLITGAIFMLNMTISILFIQMFRKKRRDFYH
ncbi:glycosyltransferase family 2 protein [Haloplasma contractile]